MLFITGTSSDKIQNITVDYTPKPPQANKNVTITFMGILSKIALYT